MGGPQDSGAVRGRLELGVLGAAGLLDGFVAMDPDSISCSLDDLDQCAADVMDVNQKGDWYDIVQSV